MAEHYIIILLADVTQNNIDNCIEDSFDSLRISNDELKTVLKWNGETPYGLASYEQYTRDEINAILNDPENGWIPEEE